MQGLRQKVEDEVKELENMALRKKTLKRKANFADQKEEPAVSEKEEPAKVEIKEEPVKDEEGALHENGKPENAMNKTELVQFHLLKVLIKHTNKKKNPVFCPACNKVIEGRNAAKIYQHTSGAEHRRKLAHLKKHNGMVEAVGAVKVEKEEEIGRAHV